MLSKSREDALGEINRIRDKKASMAIFCTASHWNTEAILKAANDFAVENGIRDIPIAVAITCNYRHMSQAKRVTYSKDLKTGFLSIIDYVKRLCDGEDSPYRNVKVLPHLDHADPEYDSWALTKGVDYLASVMFDTQRYPLKDGKEMTGEYVRQYSDRVLVEGIMDELSVLGDIKGQQDNNYVEKAVEYVRSTAIDFLVADLGTEQQSSSVGKSTYLKQRAAGLTAALGKPMLVLHGTSCLNNEQIAGLAEDGIIRVNMWTRIARESGQYAAERLLSRARSIFTGDFEAAESNQYLRDSIDKSSQIMYETLDLLQYKNLAE